MNAIYRVVYWKENGDIRVTAPTHFDDAYVTAEIFEGVIYRMDNTQPTKGKR